MPMFDIKNSKDVVLNDNKTDQPDFATIDNVEGIEASGNEVNSQKSHREDIVDVKPSVFGIGLNVNEALRRWQNRNKRK